MNSDDRFTTSQGTFFLSACFAGLAALSYVIHDGGAPTQYAAFVVVSLTALAVSLFSFPFRAAGDASNADADQSADPDLEALALAVGVLSPVASVPSAPASSQVMPQLSS